MNFVAIFFISFQGIIEFFIYLTDVKRIPNLDSSFMNFILHLWLFTLFYTLIFYVASSFMDPGILSINWLDEAHSDPNFKEELDDNGEKSFCEICNIPRPLRAHHCSTCKRCVLLMDHHCDFIGNCVGFRNYKCFLVFLISFMIHGILTYIILFRLIFSSKERCKEEI